MPIHKNIKSGMELPYTISYVIRKRTQVDNLNELPKEKRPPDSIMWDGTSEELEDWLDRVLDRKKNAPNDGLSILINPMEVEG